ncbi:hypothetical protein [Paenibacillus kandeliae]|uniref:hypothetical protein n=1 Tax=Paenibacillus kandeliae TaxID=3231269 RepID=UPI0034586E99
MESKGNLNQLMNNHESQYSVEDDSIEKDNVIQLKLPNATEITTFRHSLYLLKKRKRELMVIINRHKINIPTDFDRVGELLSFLVKIFEEGQISMSAFQDFREAAFDPNLQSTDGFFLTFIHDFGKISENKILSYIERWKEGIQQNDKPLENNYQVDVELRYFSSERCQFVFIKKNERLIYDNQSMFSKSYYDIQKVVVEIYFLEQVIYFQTSNSVKFNAIRPLVASFLNYMTEDKHVGIKLLFPKMSQSLNFVISEDGRTATDYTNINRNTIKLLDLFLEIENSNTFSNFECIDIKFDHEDTTNKSDLHHRIGSQAYGCDIGDLFKKEEIKQHILNNRMILEIEFKIEHTTFNELNHPRKHIITAGIINDKSKIKGIRIYIDNSDYLITQVVKDAYNDLKNMFITHLKDSDLKNESKLKEMLGI